ncbi:MAG: hypothetical protein JO316_10115 [Abitibacteriaceae bacterium]|nr:hypothetical protein [Abditibacteriaceae bacterium]
MNPKYLTVEEVAQRAGEDGFPRNVRRAVIPHLIKKGLLHGKQEDQHQLVADDDALARLTAFGVEQFVYNQQGYSFMAVRAPIEEVARHLAAGPGVANYEASVQPLPMQEDVAFEMAGDVRQAFLVQMRASPEWSVVLQTIHWFQNCDAVMVTALALALSRHFQTVAAASWDDDFSGSSLLVCENGERKYELSDESDEVDESDEDDENELHSWVRFYAFFYEQGIALPASFIGTASGRATLYVADPAAVLRADHIALRVPRPLESTGPHVFEKLGMMAQALAEGADDEADFLSKMRAGVWHQAQALLASGQF